MTSEEQAFEAVLSDMFDVAPAMGDEADFVARVEQRLTLDRLRRRAVLVLAGVAGAGVAGVELVTSGLLHRAPVWAAAAAGAAHSRFDHAVIGAAQSPLLQSALGDSEYRWIAVGGALALSWLVGRRLERA